MTSNITFNGFLSQGKKHTSLAGLKMAAEKQSVKSRLIRNKSDSHIVPFHYRPDDMYKLSTPGAVSVSPVIPVPKIELSSKLDAVQSYSNGRMDQISLIGTKPQMTSKMNMFSRPRAPRSNIVQTFSVQDQRTPVVVFGKMTPQARTSHRDDPGIEPSSLQSPQPSPLRKYTTTASLLQMRSAAHRSENPLTYHGSIGDLHMKSSAYRQSNLKEGKTSAQLNTPMSAHFGQMVSKPQQHEIRLFGSDDNQQTSTKPKSKRRKTITFDDRLQYGNPNISYQMPVPRFEEERLPFDEHENPAEEQHPEDKDKKSSLSVVSDVRQVSIHLTGFPKGPYHIKEYFCQKYNLPEYKFSAFMKIMKTVRDPTSSNLHEGGQKSNIKLATSIMEHTAGNNHHGNLQQNIRRVYEGNRGYRMRTASTTALLDHTSVSQPSEHVRSFMKPKDISSSNPYLGLQRGMETLAVSPAVKPARRKNLTHSHKRVYEIQRTIVSNNQGKSLMMPA